MKLPVLPNELIEKIGYESDIDARLALRLKPRKIERTVLETFDLQFKKKYENIVRFENGLLTDNWWLKDNKLFSITMIVAKHHYSFIFAKNDRLIIKTMEAQRIVLTYWPRKDAMCYTLYNWITPRIEKEHSPLYWRVQNNEKNRALFQLTIAT